MKMNSIENGLWIGVFLLLLSDDSVRCSRILTVAPFFGSSHSQFVQTITLHLAKQGHDVTVITTNLVKDPPPNYHQIPVDMDRFKNEVANIDPWRHKVESTIDCLFFGWRNGIVLQDFVLSDPTVKNFNENDKSQFDVVIVEMFFQEAMYTFAHKYKAPLILLETTSAKRQLEDIMGSPAPSSYIPFEFFGAAGDFSMVSRAHNWFIGMVDYIGRRYHVAKNQNAIIDKYFKHIPGPLPTVEELENSVSLVLVNTHFSYDIVYPIVPGIVHIGGVHIKPVKKLPEKIQRFLDGATDGAIYFSLGSHLLSSSIPQHKINAFVNVFRRLKQRVLWKWEDDKPPQLANVLTETWLPQNDILAHPNIKVFITHGGMLGIQEAIDKGVPMVSIPIFADQYANTAKLIAQGVAVELDYLEISEETVSAALDKLLNVSSYRHMAKQLSVRFRDRQNKPLDTATYWIEYVIRHKEASLLKSRYASMSWYKKYMVDVALVALGLLASIIGVILYIRHYSKQKEIKRITKAVMNEKYKRT